MEDQNLDPNNNLGAKFSAREDFAPRTEGLGQDALDRFGANIQNASSKEFREPTNPDISEMAARYGLDINKNDKNDYKNDDKDGGDFGGDRGPTSPDSQPPSDSGANALPMPTEEEFREASGFQQITPPEQRFMQPVGRQEQIR